VSGPSEAGSSDEEDGEGEGEEEDEEEGPDSDSQLAHVSHTDAAAAVDVSLLIALLWTVSTGDQGWQIATVSH